VRSARCIGDCKGFCSLRVDLAGQVQGSPPLSSLSRYSGLWILPRLDSLAKPQQIGLYKELYTKVWGITVRQ
jgi:hypothetical protein